MADLLAELDEVPVDHRSGLPRVLLDHLSWKPQSSKEIQASFPGRGANRVLLLFCCCCCCCSSTVLVVLLIALTCYCSTSASTSGTDGARNCYESRVSD